MGYSVLWAGSKWLAPSIEIGFGDDHPSRRTYDAALADMQARAAALSPAIRDMGGEVYCWPADQGGDRHEILLLVPPDAPSAFGSSFADWQRKLSSILLAAEQSSRPRPLRGPVRKTVIQVGTINLT